MLMVKANTCRTEGVLTSSYPYFNLFSKAISCKSKPGLLSASIRNSQIFSPAKPALWNCVANNPTSKLI